MPGLTLNFGLGLGPVSGGQNALQKAQAHFSGGVDGFLYSLTTSGSLFQDIAASPSTAAGDGDVCGSVIDRSGNDMTLQSVGTGNRGIVDVDSDGTWIDLDGSDDQYELDISWSGLMRVYIVIKTTDTFGVTFNKADGGAFFQTFEDGSSANTYGPNTGTPTDYVDNVVVSPATRDGLHTAMADGNAHIVVSRNLDLSTWTTFNFEVSGFPAIAVDGKIGSMIAYPEASITSDIDADFYNLLAEEYGLPDI